MLTTNDIRSVTKLQWRNTKDRDDMAKQQKQRRIDGTALAEIERLAEDHPAWGGAQIHGELERNPALTGRLPTVRTVQNIVKGMRPADPTGPWSLAEASGEEASIVLPVFIAVVRQSRGQVARITRREAEWIVKLRTAVSDLPPWEAYRLARQYMVCEDRKESSAVLDLYLGFAPWRGGQEMEEYTLAMHIISGRLRPEAWPLTEMENTAAIEAAARLQRENAYIQAQQDGTTLSGWEEEGEAW